MHSICKSYSGVSILKDVGLDVAGGRVHALLGENGAGKSTLMKILAGLIAPDSGEIMLEGKQVRFHGARDAIQSGIAMIHQELAYVPDMTVSENMFLGNELRSRGLGIARSKEMDELTRGTLARLGIDIDVSERMKNLRISERQIIEIAKATSRNAKVLIMDEPTSALTDNEVGQINKIITDLCSKGTAIIYISHKMEEIFKIADNYSVLRDGSMVSNGRIADVDEKSLIAMMVGRELGCALRTRVEPRSELALEVRNFSKSGSFDNINFSVNYGEIVGFAGLMGSGRTEVVNCVFGLDSADGGEILVDGKPVHIRNPKDAMRHGIGLVSEDRKTLGLVLGLSVRENISLPNLGRCSRYGIVNGREEKSLVSRYVSSLRIKVHADSQSVMSLSGGNQQKVVLGKVLLHDPKVLILDEPTRGIDVGAKAEIHELIFQLAKEGNAVIIVSSELPEVMKLSTRILVMRNGRITGEVLGEGATEERIMSYAFGN
jgi:ABC-type sugar transport system ATPase subunit